MCLPHEFGVGHNNEMGTETWRVGVVKRIEKTVTIREASISNHYRPLSASAPADLRTVDTTRQYETCTGEQRQAAVDRVIQHYGADTAAATDVLLMLDLVA